MSSEKENPNDKPQAGAGSPPAGQAGRPPVPPPPGKKPGGLPKGPVPPRNPIQVPRVPTPPSPAAAAPNAMPAKPFSPPPAMGMPPTGFSPAGFSPAGFPPKMPAGPPASIPPATANFNNQMNQAESAKSDLEQKVADLEKRLMEEREKVLLAQLRSKEEESVSAKVETSIKDIQDKLRRERKEQDLEEMRRKAEAKTLQMERRLAEEREAWVSTLKGQLNQRDQITQEMESHFSTRLKDLEYRWAQEKSGLESSLRDRDAEIVRVRQEMALKAEHDKAFWEDRVKSISNDREKLERDMERLSLKFQQEKEQLVFERQNLRDSVSKLETAIKFVEEQSRVEKAALKRELDATLDIEKRRASLERENLQKQVTDLTHGSEAVEPLKTQLTQAQVQLAQLQSQLSEKDRAADQLRSQIREEQTSTENLKREMERRDAANQFSSREMEDIRRRATSLQTELDDAKKTIADFERGALNRRHDMTKIQDEYEMRIKTLQNRLDWYDANVKREYDIARDKVQEEMEALQVQLKDAQQAAESSTGAKERLVQTEQERNAVRMELENLRNEWKEVQHEMGAQLHEAEEKLKAEQRKAEELLDGKLAIDQELRQRISQIQAQQDGLEKKQAETERLQRMIQVEHDKNQGLHRQIDEYKRLMEAQGVDNVVKLKSDLAEKESELEQAKQKLMTLKAVTDSSDQKEDIYRDKERVLRQLVTDKEETLAEFKNRIHVLERQLNERSSEREAIEAEGKKKIERFIQNKQREIEERLAEQKAELEKTHRQEIEVVKASSAGPGAPVDINEIEHQARQRVESEFLEQLREKETSMDQKVKNINEEAKKEADKWRWENENLKEELRRSRESRMQIEREAQDLIQQAEVHYKKEFEKRMAEIEEDAKKSRGLFGTIGKILDTPIIDTNKKKDR